jgi:hypothetical protein
MQTDEANLGFRLSRFTNVCSFKFSAQLQSVAGGVGDGMDKLDSKKKVLRDLRIGEAASESELRSLPDYFVETTAWYDVHDDRVDFVLGTKGSGKSALYQLLLEPNSSKVLRKRGIITIGVENPLPGRAPGGLIEKNANLTANFMQVQFLGLWKLCFLCQVAAKLREEKLARDPGVRNVISDLEALKLLPEESSPSALKTVFQYVSSVEVGVGAQILKVTLRRPAPSAEQVHVEIKEVWVDDLLSRLNSALAKANVTIWLALDRLDVPFAANQAQEMAALVAVYLTYQDFTTSRIRLKIFLRNDIWRRISNSPEGGRLSEVSHVRETVISWDNKGLFNLVMKRILHNKQLCAMFKVDAAKVLKDYKQQEELFYRIFPEKMDGVRTFDWMLAQTCDGTRMTMPREVIELLNFARVAQLAMLEKGLATLPSETLFDAQSLKDAAREVSTARYEKTLRIEYAPLEKRFAAFRGQKSEQTAKTLVRLWNLKPTKPQDDLEALARGLALQLVEIGFLQRRQIDGETVFIVPPLYQRYLGMTAGRAT